MSAIPRVVISAPSSGHGKTAVAVGLLAAFTARGYRTTGFKIGPDHVDAAYLGLASGRPGRNLDPRLTGVARIGALFAYGAASLDIAVVEGTMGLFDGLAGRTDSESTAQIAGLLRAPVVLVVDVAAMGQSVAALVHGFRAYDELLWLGGVILNRVASTRHEQLLREALDDIGVPVLGALRRGALTEIGDQGAPLPGRHHGVEPVAHGSIAAVRAVRRLGEVIGGAVDVDRVMAVARSAPRLSTDPWSAEDQLHVGTPAVGRRPLVAVAGGPQFSYSYPETAELLTAAGAEVVTFDPLHDEHLPRGVDGVVLGAGLPEAYAEELSFNAALRSEMLAHARAGRPIAAEGTGLIWLCTDLDGRPMCGILNAAARRSDTTVLGYREATAHANSILLPGGATVTGHKMHRTTITPRSGPNPAWSWTGGPVEGFVHGKIHASMLALHWAGHPEIAARFVSTLPAPPALPVAVAGSGPSGPGGWAPGGSGSGGSGSGGSVSGGPGLVRPGESDPMDDSGLQAMPAWASEYLSDYVPDAPAPALASAPAPASAPASAPAAAPASGSGPASGSASGPASASRPASGSGSGGPGPWVPPVVPVSAGRFAVPVVPLGPDRAPVFPSAVDRVGSVRPEDEPTASVPIVSGGESDPEPDREPSTSVPAVPRSGSEIQPGADAWSGAEDYDDERTDPNVVRT